MRKFLVISAALLLSGCSTLGFGKKPEPTVTVCSKVREPPREPLRNFTFYDLPPGTKSLGGVELKAGLTEDGVVAILDNLSRLQKREGKWQGRASAINKCIDEEAAERGKQNANK